MGNQSSNTNDTFTSFIVEENQGGFEVAANSLPFCQLVVKNRKKVLVDLFGNTLGTIAPALFSLHILNKNQEIIAVVRKSSIFARKASVDCWILPKPLPSGSSVSILGEPSIKAKGNLSTKSLVFTSNGSEVAKTSLRKSGNSCATTTARYQYNTSFHDDQFMLLFLASINELYSL